MRDNIILNISKLARYCVATALGTLMGLAFLMICAICVPVVLWRVFKEADSRSVWKIGGKRVPRDIEGPDMDVALTSWNRWKK